MPMQSPLSPLVRLLSTAWLAGYSGLVYAYANANFSKEMRSFDYESLVWAAAIGAGAGLARTILWLASHDTVVVRLWGQLWRDLVIALFGGAMAYIALLLAVAWWPEVFIKELRFLIILLAGASRGRWQNALADLVGAVLSRGMAYARGGPAPPPRDPPPSTVTLPLSDK